MKLNNERIYLRSLCISDAAIILESTRDEEIRYMTGTRQHFTLEHIENHIVQINEDPSRYDFAICIHNTDNMIGELSLLDIDTNNNKAGFRISMLAIALTSKGYGTEAIDTILQFAFNKLNLNRIQLEVFSHNKRGIRAYEKVGFKKEGTLRQSLLYNGVYSDEIIMAMLREDFLRKNV